MFGFHCYSLHKWGSVGYTRLSVQGRHAHSLPCVCSDGHLMASQLSLSLGWLNATCPSRGRDTSSRYQRTKSDLDWVLHFLMSPSPWLKRYSCLVAGLHLRVFIHQLRTARCFTYFVLPVCVNDARQKSTIYIPQNDHNRKINTSLRRFEHKLSIVTFMEEDFRQDSCKKEHQF